MIEKDFTEYSDRHNDQLNYLQKLSKPSNTLYNFLLITVVFSLVALPFIKIKITSSAPFSVQSNLLNEAITSPSAGRILSIKVINNRHINKGDTVAVINDNSASNEIGINFTRESEIIKNLHDIQILEKLKDKDSLPKLSTGQYQNEFFRYREQLIELKAKYDNALQNYNRFSLLLKNKAISNSEYEPYELAYKQALSELKISQSQSQAQWQASKFQLRQELTALKIQQNQLKQVIHNGVILANISGNGYKEEGIQPGAYIQAGQKIAQIYPDVNLIAICLVAPKDIGFVKVGQKIQFQIDAYNYSEWGMLNGSVFEIGKDIEMVDNKPIYLVKCKLHQSFLKLKSGYRGNIIKGMTGKANFYLNTRTAWQLLFSTFNDWFDPKATNN